MRGDLQLALSKWGLEEASSPAGWGVLSKAFSAVELDLASYLGCAGRERLRMRKVVQQSSTRVIARIPLRRAWTQEELGDFLNASLEEFDASLLFWSFHSGFKRFDRSEGGPGLVALSRVRRERPDLRSRPWFFEWGQEDSIASTRFLVHASGRASGHTCGGLFPEAGFVVDPDFHQRHLGRLAVPLHFKLHGWHSERWVRRYGPTQTPRLVERAREFARPKSRGPEAKGPEAKETLPTFLMLAHSGRIEEGAPFRKELDRETLGKE